MAELVNENGIVSRIATEQYVQNQLTGLGGGTPSLTPEQMIDLSGNLDENVPFNSIVLSPTAAAFDTLLAHIAFGSLDDSSMVSVLLTNQNVFELMGLSLPPGIEGGAGMWIVVFNNMWENEEESSIRQAIRVTDGTNILIPEVRLSDLVGDHEIVFVGAQNVDNSDVLHVSSDAETPCLTAIEGCGFFFRMTHAQAIQCLWKKTEAYEEKSV